ncbi:SirB1 family protein [Litorilituus lipolyticus]|uniref:Tetratricopeptide repeat protein n=1 Tax=Litorilituus lipolyticus TaxID=2491017 RepID=A0A502KM42_9GAMM|nr:tetratricopeptide repeat protein [Litorilituus lipolyticus]TPH12536.1 tetratricopeptide repeat protein [Litorilituus lipolyticus]
MNELLLSEINSTEKDLLQTMVLLEEFILAKQPSEGNGVSSDNSLDGLELIIKQCQAVIEEVESPLDRAEILLNELYFQHLFIDKFRRTYPVEAYCVAPAINSRLMSPVLKAVIVCEIINACGFETDIVFIPSKMMVRICCDEKYAIIFDATTGESLNWNELDLRLDELNGDPTQHELSSVESEAILVEHLTAFKNTLIKEQTFDKALRCVDVILALTPDDPLQRRDRGYLLHQLDCFNVAVDDYRYFVEQCPKDPAAKLLKLQLDKISILETVLH